MSALMGNKPLLAFSLTLDFIIFLAGLSSQSVDIVIYVERVLFKKNQINVGTIYLVGDESVIANVLFSVL